jgi:hypothetical protein
MAERLTHAEQAAILTWVHGVQHLRARKGMGPLPEGEWVAECWMPVNPPDWALASAASGAPGSLWCPVLSPHLADMSGVRQDA